MASHGITKELSVSSNAHVVSYETGSEMIQLAGMGIGTDEGGKNMKTSPVQSILLLEIMYSLVSKEILP
jgi:hypothetical protein